jgi:hypothetical protein
MSLQAFLEEVASETLGAIFDNELTALGEKHGIDVDADDVIKALLNQGWRHVSPICRYEHELVYAEGGIYR